MVTYLHPERFIQRVFVTVSFQRGMLEILPCKYQFACRQFAMDDNKRPKAFELKATPDVNQVKIESSASAKIAVVGIRTVVLRGCLKRHNYSYHNKQADLTSVNPRDVQDCTPYIIIVTNCPHI